VAIMGAILLGHLGAVPERGGGVEVLAAAAGTAGINMTAVFRWLFVAADIFLLLALVALLRLEERELHGPATAPKPQPAE